MKCHVSLFSRTLFVCLMDIVLLTPSILPSSALSFHFSSVIFFNLPRLIRLLTPFCCFSFLLFCLSSSVLHHNTQVEGVNDALGFRSALGTYFPTIFTILLFIYWNVLHIAESPNHLVDLHFHFSFLPVLFFGASQRKGMC